MCTVVVSVRPGHAWPLLFAANRDERLDREWDPPGPHWPSRPGVIGGRDRLQDGTWMAMRGGMIAAVLNRPGSLGPLAGKRSRGELPLIALQWNTAADAAEALAGLEASQYRTFNMVLADAEGAWFVRGSGTGRPHVVGLDPGLHMITAHDPNDRASPRTREHLPRFQAAHPPEPERGEWGSWIRLLGDRSGQRGTAINVPGERGFGTVCASLAAVSEAGRAVWLFASGPPDSAPFLPVTLP
ncbi:MAG TPA: NRDE family protein [Acetobacteraceae bacterium]|nr:NRDE family protein [Acetobacteraceae bacterium]